MEAHDSDARTDVLQGLARRWNHARRAALRSVASGAGPECTEEELMERALATDPEAAAAALFENGLRLGRSFATFYERELALGELGEALLAMGTPCLRGAWAREASEPAVRLRRPGCDASRDPRACDLWSEAISGLSLGLSGGIRLSRHASCGHGDDECVDVLHVRSDSPLRYGPIDPETQRVLEGIASYVRRFDSSIRVTFHGISEGSLYYEVGGLPHLRPRDAAPRAVLPPDHASAP
jgi:hypothetical protein